MKLALDHHLSPAIAESMRRRSADVVAAAERDWHRLQDESLLERCSAERRALVTGDVGDFMPIVSRWSGEGRSHAGVILVPNAAAPTRGDAIGKCVSALADLVHANPGPEALVDLVVWLVPPKSEQ